MLGSEALDALGLSWVADGVQLVAAQDVEGTWWWLVDTGSERLMGPLGSLFTDAVRDLYESFVPDPGQYEA